MLYDIDHLGTAFVLLVISMIFHYGAYSITVYMLEHGLARKANPLTRTSTGRTIGLFVPIFPFLTVFIGFPPLYLAQGYYIVSFICMADFFWDLFMWLDRSYHVRKLWGGMKNWKELREIYGESFNFHALEDMDWEEN
jgi:hypothetical protein